MNQEIISLLKAALECSVFLNPREPGLSYEELREVGHRANYQDGEIGDAIAHAGTAYFGVNLIVPDEDPQKTPISATSRLSTLSCPN